MIIDDKCHCCLLNCQDLVHRVVGVDIAFTWHCDNVIVTLFPECHCVNAGVTCNLDFGSIPQLLPHATGKTKWCLRSAWPRSLQSCSIRERSRWTLAARWCGAGLLILTHTQHCDSGIIVIRFCYHYLKPSMIDWRTDTIFFKRRNPLVVSTL